MTREIKFRAWDKTRKLMVGTDYPNNWEDDTDEWYADVTMMSLQGIEDFQEPKMKERFELMQYTGLTDKNGKEIYEGDVLKKDKEARGNKREFGTVEVKFGEHCFDISEYGACAFGWYVHGHDGYVREDDKVDTYPIEQEPITDYLDDYEVIGNIYENPELINK